MSDVCVKAGFLVVLVFLLGASGCGLISREEERTEPAGLEIQDATGRIQSVNAESDRFAFIPNDGERMIFRVNENSAITVGGENTPLSEVEKGQRGTVSYIARDDDRNIARIVDLRESGRGAAPEDTAPEDTGGEPAAPTEATDETTGS